MNKVLYIGILVLSMLTHVPAGAAPEVQLKSVHWSEGRTRVLLDFSGPPNYRLPRASGSARLAIELRNASTLGRLVQPPASHPIARRIGWESGKTGHRLNVDLKYATEARSHIEILPKAVRLVVEWPDVRTGSSGPGKSADAAPAVRPRAAPRNTKAASSRHGDFVLAIDAGHGGKDTGAIGPAGTMEKNVVLAIARKLAGYVRAESGMRPVMVRKGDRYISLQRRVEIARGAGAHLMVSLHADADDNGDVQGSSVYTHFKPTVTAPSNLAATHVLRQLKKKFPVHHEQVQSASFMVLKCGGMPCMLVETAFISNPEEEHKLKTPAYQERIARALFWGIHAYVADKKPALLAGAEAADGRAD